MHRNSVLYDTSLTESMRGSLVLEKELRIEWRLEFVGLSNIVKTVIFGDIGTVMDG